MNATKNVILKDASTTGTFFVGPGYRINLVSYRSMSSLVTSPNSGMADGSIERWLSSFDMIAVSLLGVDSFNDINVSGNTLRLVVVLKKRLVRLRKIKPTKNVYKTSVKRSVTGH